MHTRGEETEGEAQGKGGVTTPVDRFERVVKATVKLPKQKGQGVLATHGPKGSRGGYVITAAHCLQLNRRTVFSLISNDFLSNDVRTADGVEFRMSPFMVELGLDVAVLWPLDDQEPAFEKDRSPGWICDRLVTGLPAP